MEEEEPEIAKVANLNGKGGGKQGLQVSEKETDRERGVLLFFFFFFHALRVVIHKISIFWGGINVCLQYPIPAPVPAPAPAPVIARARAKVPLLGQCRQ